MPLPTATHRLDLTHHQLSGRRAPPLAEVAKKGYIPRPLRLPDRLHLLSIDQIPRNQMGTWERRSTPSLAHETTRK